jgi:hypothetical protein
VDAAMKQVNRLRELEAECRQRAVGEPDRRWYWLAQAARYQVKADQEIALHFEECSNFEQSAPEVKLAQWPNGRDTRRSMEPIIGDRWSA